MISAAADDLTPSDLLGRVAQRRRDAMLAEIEVLQLAVTWAHANPELDPTTDQPVPTPRVDDHALAAHYAGIDPEESMESPSWAGLPRIAWDADAGFGAAANLGTSAARSLIRDALILSHRLPQVWRRMSAGHVPAWRARQIATAVVGAPDDVCVHVDREIAGRAETVGYITLNRIIGEAMIRLYPDEVEAASLERLDRMHVSLDAHVTHTGLVRLDAVGEFAEFDDLDTTLTELAGRMHEYDETVPVDAPLDYRRARALGLLADPDRAAELLRSPIDDAGPQKAGAPATDTRTRRVSLVLHLTPDVLTGSDPVAMVASASGRAIELPFLSDVVAAWCGRPGTAITVQPLIDLNRQLATTAYQPTAAITRHIELRDQTCRFPHCGHQATRSDKDHVTPFDRGGPTSTAQMIALCRHHHRLKTHAGYLPQLVEPGVVHWISPHGFEFLVTPDGTHQLSRPTNVHVSSMSA